MVVVCGVAVGEDNWGDVGGRGTRHRGGCGEQAPEARLCCCLPTSTRRGPFPAFPPAPFFFNPFITRRKPYLLYTKIPLTAPNCLHSPMKRLSNSHHFG